MPGKNDATLYRKELKKARTQEDIDIIVRAAAESLSVEAFGRFLPAVLKRRQALPERGEPRG